MDEQLTARELSVDASSSDAIVGESGCHGGADKLREAAKAAGMSETLAQLTADYPKRSARSAAEYVPGIRLAACRLADAPDGDDSGAGRPAVSTDSPSRRTSMARSGRSVTCPSIPRRSSRASCSRTFARPSSRWPIPRSTTRSSSPTCAYLRRRVCRCGCCRERSTAFASSESTCRLGVPTHAEAKDVLAGAMLAYARREIGQGPVAAPRAGVSDLPTVTLLGEMFPGDPIGLGRMLEPMGLAAGPVVPTRRMARTLFSARLCCCRGDPSVLSASVREFESAGRPIVGSAPVGAEGVASWLSAIGRTCGVAAPSIAAAQNTFVAATRAALANCPVKGRLTISGYEGSELLVARLLVESGADVRYVGTACARSRWSEDDKAWLESKGVLVAFRASLEQDLAALAEFKPDLAIGTTPVVQKAKEISTPALYFTNLISARPLMGPAGAGALAQVVNTAIAGKSRFEDMTAFFEGVGKGPTAGIWQGKPKAPRKTAPNRPIVTRNGREEPTTC